MRVLIGNITFYDEPEVDSRYAEVFGEYEIIDMTYEDFIDYTNTTQDSWISEEYTGKIFHIEELKL